MRAWRFRLRMALVAVLMAGLAGAQSRKSSPAKPQPAPQADVIKTLQVTGNKRFSAEEILALSGLKPGVAPTQRLFEESRDRLLDSGVFETVGWQYVPDPAGGYTATLEVREADQFLPWMIERLPVTAAELSALAAKRFPIFGAEIPTTERSIDRTAALLQELAKSKGFTDAVIGRVGLVGKDRLMIVFQPKTPAQKIARIIVTGTRVVPKGDLQKAMNDIAIGTPYTDSNIQFLFDNQARPILETYARLRAKLVKTSAEPAPGSTGVAVTLEVEEGPEFLLSGIEVTGTPFSRQEIDEEGQWPVGKSANHSQIGVGMSKITAKLRKLGYLKAKYAGQRRLDDQKNEVWLTLNYDLGPQYRFAKLNVLGLDLEGEPAIRKIYKPQPGDPFDPDYPEEFLKQVRASQMFDFLGKTKADVKLDDRKLTAEVTLDFKGEEPETKKKRPF